MTAKHTPGPWKVETHNAYHTSYIIRGGKTGNKIAQCFNWQDRGFDVSSEQNAALIASSPDLLEALEDLVYCAENGIEPIASLEQAREAIAKAKNLPQ